MGSKRKLTVRKPQCTCNKTLVGQTCAVCSVGSNSMLNIPAKHTKPMLKATKKRKPTPKPLYGGGVPLRGGKVGISNTPPVSGRFDVKVKLCKVGTTKYLI